LEFVNGVFGIVKYYSVDLNGETVDEIDT